MIAGRALHYVLKIADRTSSMKFFREILGMKVLRHEEFTEGCAAACNGPYDNRWSKTMIGYGPEDSHFVLELTYNYNVSNYNLGNDLVGITIQSQEAIEKAKDNKWPIEESADGSCIVKSPDGYPVILLNKSQSIGGDPIKMVTLACSDLSKSIKYWNGILGCTIFSQSENYVELGYSSEQAKLKLQNIGDPITREEAYGRIAFSCPLNQQPDIAKLMEENKCIILTPLIELPTPGKATVRVIILADPDGHEICFVDDEGFRQLSAFDPKSEAELDKYIKKDIERQKEKQN